MNQETKREVHPPATLEGWYVLHQIFEVDRLAWKSLASSDRADVRRRAANLLEDLSTPETGADEAERGWSACVELVGSRADLMLIHMRPTLDALGDAESAVKGDAFFDYMNLEYSFLSVTEAGLYHITAQIAREAAAAGASPHDDEYRLRLLEKSNVERESAFVRRRLYPQLPPDMPYVCFYPMSKKREGSENWYALTLDERSRLMMAHGLTGRRYAGRVLQIISGAIGLDDWEWGVTLFSADPLEFKKLVTDMRFDEVSARYAEFGEFFVGKVVRPEEWVGKLG